MCKCLVTIEICCSLALRLAHPTNIVASLPSDRTSLSAVYYVVGYTHKKQDDEARVVARVVADLERHDAFKADEAAALAIDSAARSRLGAVARSMTGKSVRGVVFQVNFCH
jgi:hypothetical protein